MSGRRRAAATRWRRALPRVLGWPAALAALAAAGVVAARRLDEGDEAAPAIRRVLVTGGLHLRPVSSQLARVRLDLALGGVELDLTGIGRPPSGVDLRVNLVMGGVGVTVPADWRVWWSFAGVGGIGSDGGVARTGDEHEADLRIRAAVLFGGVGVQGAS